MALLQSSPPGDFTTWFLIAAFIVLLVVLCVLLFTLRNSDRLRYVLGIVVGLIGLYNISYPVIVLIDGASLGQYVVSNVFVGVALLFLAAGTLPKKHNFLFLLVFLVLIGPGIFLMIGSWVGSGFPPSYLLGLSAFWALAWLSLVAMMAYGYFKKPEPAQAS